MSFNPLTAQTKDSSVVKLHSAKKATLLSTFIPGTGQIYNKKYWKAPIVWGGLGTCIYFIGDNRRFFKLLKNESLLRQNDPDHISSLTYIDLKTYSNATLDIVSEEDLANELDKRKRWLDLSYFALIGVYGLQIIDANVDGHLFNYDISPNISMKISPSFNVFPTASTGLNLSFSF